MTNISMNRNSRVYTEKVDEFVILIYTIADGRVKEVFLTKREKKLRLKVVLRYGIIRTVEK